jgi:hypothetical protein
VRSEFFAQAKWRCEVCVEVLEVPEKRIAKISNDQASHDKTGLLLGLLTLKMEALRSFEIPESLSTDNTTPKYDKS